MCDGGSTKQLCSLTLEEIEELCFGGVVQKFQYNLLNELIFILIEL